MTGALTTAPSLLEKSLHLNLQLIVYSIIFVITERISIPDMDLLFAISTTATDSEENLAYVKEIMNKIIAKYGIKKIKYSLLTFGQEPFIHFKFNFISDDVTRLKLAIERSKMKSSGASLEKAMEESKKVFDEAEGWY